MVLIQVDPRMPGDPRISANRSQQVADALMGVTNNKQKPRKSTGGLADNLAKVEIDPSKDFIVPWAQLEQAARGGASA